MSTFELVAQARDAKGKAHTRRMRRLEDRFPAVIYGAGKEPQAISMSQKDLMVAMQDEAIFSHILTLDVDGKKEKVVIKALQRHPYKAMVMHADFLRISATDKITMTVPLHFLNEEEAPGAKASGVISHLMTEVEVRCLPTDLPEFLEVDVANVEMDASLHLSDIALPKGVEFTHEITEDNNQPILSIHKSRAAVDADNEAEADDAASEEGESTSEE